MPSKLGRSAITVHNEAQFQSLVVAKGPPVRVVIASSVRLVREGLEHALRNRETIKVVDTVSLDAPSMTRITEASPDVVLVDIAHADAKVTAMSIRFACSKAKLVAFALAEIDDEVFACAAAGFAGYVPGESGAEDIHIAVVDAVNGRMACSPQITAALFSRLSGFLQTPAASEVPGNLTARESTILSLVEKGQSNKEIARQLSVSPATVKNHIHNILQKLQVGRRGEAIARVQLARAG